MVLNDYNNNKNKKTDIYQYGKWNAGTTLLIHVYTGKAYKILIKD